MSLLDAEFEINKNPKLIPIVTWLKRNRLAVMLGTIFSIFLFSLVMAINSPEEPKVFVPEVNVSFNEGIETTVETHTVPSKDSRNVQFEILVDKKSIRDATYRYLESEVEYKYLYDVKNEIESIVSSLVAKNIIVQKVTFLPKSDL